MMTKQGNRKDFISDASSSDEESLPEVGSLWERLARKRTFPALSAVSSASQQDPGENTEFVDLSEDTGQTYTQSECTDTITDTVESCNIDEKCTENFSDSSGDETEKLSLSQVIASSRKDTGSNVTCGVDKPGVKVKKKRTAEEIEESKKKAQEKREERERQKLAKEAEKQMKKAERETKRQFSLGSCLKYIKVLVDTHIVNTCGLGVVLFKACEELGVSCETRELPQPFTIMWKRTVTECNLANNMQVETLQSDQEEQEMLAVIPVADFVLMVHAFKQTQRGMLNDEVTLTDFVQRMKTIQADKSLTLIVQGLEQYFRDLKSKTNKQYREAVQSANTGYAGKTSRSKPGLVTVSRVDVEEAVTDVLLQTGCSTFMLETPEDVADTVRRFSKAVAERPAKKDRFDPIFSFHEEGVSGVKVDKNGVGLLKVWKQQLLQFKNVSPDVGQAIIAEYPSPLLLRQAYQKCSSEKEAIRLLENIVVRRGAGVLETTRRVGKELSRRIYIFFTSSDPGLVIK